MSMNEIRDLISKLNYHTKLYDMGKPEISDKEWDDMYFELVRLENQEQCYFEDSPTQRVNYQVVNQLNKIEHSHPMLSLNKTKEISEVESFLNNKEGIIMAKMDGLTCSLTYEDGYLIKAETRGNGIIGEDVLHNILQIKNIPNKISKKGTWIIDGEVICTYENFKNFQNDYKNPRNFSSGSIRLLDSKESAMRKLSFVAWDLIDQTWYAKEDIKTLWECLFILDNLGFTTVPRTLIDSIDDYEQACPPTLEDYIKEIQEKCKKLSYPIDGVVFKYNKIKEYLAAGKTDHHFKGGLAYKFYDEEYETTLIDIEWTMGRTGVLTPVAIFEPIDIDGTEVSRASLHNISVMSELSGGFERIGDILHIYKANQIIPQISSWEHDNRDYSEDTHLFIPEICPICGEPTEIRQENDSKMLYCGNPQCGGKLLNRIDHFCSKKGLDIKGLSKATLEKLIDWGWINTYQDIFILNEYRDKWIKRPGFGVASVDKILNAIKDAKTPTLDKVIAAAGIPEIGSKVAKDLAKHYEDWEAFRNETDFLKYDGIGEVMNNNLLNFDYEDLNLDYTVNLHLNKAKRKEEINNNTSSSLNNLVFCITGKLNTFKNRNELKADIESKGGKVVDSVSSKVNYLINNDIESVSAKNKKAKELGIKILTEEAYLELL